MRKYINILYGTLLSLLFISCSSEVEETAFHCVLDMDANVPAFTSATTRATTNWKDGDVIYLYIPSGGVYGYAVYSSSINKWNANFSAKPADATSSSIYVRYFDGISNTGSSVSLSYSVAAYSDTSVKYSYSSAEGMHLTANIKPDLGRIRFKGQSGETIKVSGIKYRNTYNRSSDTFGNSSSDLSLIVNSDGYTDYIYGEFANTSRMLTLVSKGITYTTYCSANMYKAGQTGYITIPTESSHTGWATDKEDTNGNITVEEDFDNEECWDKQLSQSANISVNDISGIDESWDVKEPKAAKRTFTANGVNFDMILVEHGTFTMGATAEQKDVSALPAHKVTLTNDYYIGETEVTQALWKAVTGYSPSSDASWSSAYGLGNNYPAYYISYSDVLSFVTKLNSITGKKFRMPTEAEWEFAARGGNNSKGYVYSGSNIIDEVAWYSENCKYAAEVKTKRPNELGIYDMSGNVFEWCSDWWGSYDSSPQVNPSGPYSGDWHVLRGGCCVYDSSKCLSTYRFIYVLNPSRYDIGFRLVLSD